MSERAFDIIRIIENNLVLIIALVIFFVVSRKKNIKKLEIGPLKVENQAETDKPEVIDPKDKCPYDKAYTAARNDTRRVEETLRKEIVLAEETLHGEITHIKETVHSEIINVGNNVKELASKMDWVISKLDNLDTDQLKIIFRSTGQPPEERLLAGLKCVYKGENGDMKKAVTDMSLKWPGMYEGICAVKPDYKIPEVESQRGQGG